ncbi:hypothetical protein ANAPC1_01033 [Anaplasma phagocytophilum]|uniref:Uncharacterized protein n=1 Tax=Anaplasma phagocytophilum TaxID=948 RepID=A0AA45UTH7_ANAPH|nr:hypothetical protein ANAPC1_01033 [Anaplasma phagocytophilum]
MLAVNRADFLLSLGTQTLEILPFLRRHELLKDLRCNYSHRHPKCSQMLYRKHVFDVKMRRLLYSTYH